MDHFPGGAPSWEDPQPSIIGKLIEVDSRHGLTLRFALVVSRIALTPLYVKTAAQEASLSCWRVQKSLMTR